MSTVDIARTNKNQEDRGRQGVAVFSRLAARDLFASSVIAAQDVGWLIKLREPWYTGTFWSTISRLQVTVNGFEVPEPETLFRLRGQTVPVAFLKSFHELWWGLGEVADVLLTSPQLVDIVTEKNTVDVAIDLRQTFSYGFPDDTLPVRASSELEAH